MFPSSLQFNIIQSSECIKPDWKPAWGPVVKKPDLNSAHYNWNIWKQKNKMPGDLNDQFAEMLREFDVDGDGILKRFWSIGIQTQLHLS